MESLATLINDPEFQKFSLEDRADIRQRWAKTAAANREAGKTALGEDPKATALRFMPFPGIVRGLVAPETVPPAGKSDLGYALNPLPEVAGDAYRAGVEGVRKTLGHDAAKMIEDTMMMAPLLPGGGIQAARNLRLYRGKPPPVKVEGLRDVTPPPSPRLSTVSPAVESPTGALPDFLQRQLAAEKNLLQPPTKPAVRPAPTVQPLVESPAGALPDFLQRQLAIESRLSRPTPELPPTIAPSVATPAPIIPEVIPPARAAAIAKGKARVKKPVAEVPSAETKPPEVKAPAIQAQAPIPQVSPLQPTLPAKEPAGIGATPKLEASNLEFSEGGDALGREYHGYIRAIDPVSKKQVGYVDYSNYNGETAVKMIEVNPSSRRAGVGTALLQKLQSQSDTPIKIQGNFATEEGQALWESFKKTSEPPTLTAPEVVAKIESQQAPEHFDKPKIEKQVTKAGETFIKTEVDPNALKVPGEKTVEPGVSHPENGPIVIDDKGKVIDGRHRVVDAKAAGEATIEAYAPGDPQIERIVQAASRKLLPVVESRETLGSDGKWYGAGGHPLNVRLTDQNRIAGYSYLADNGTRVGTRQPTREAAEAAQKTNIAASDHEFRQALQKMTPEELQSQAAYWLKESPPVDPVAARTAELEAENAKLRAKAQPMQRSGGKPLPSPQQLSDFKPGIDRIERRGDRTYVVDGEGQYADVPVQHDALTPQTEANLRKLPPARLAEFRTQTESTPYLSPEGKTERLKVFDELMSKPAPDISMTKAAVTEPPRATPPAPATQQAQPTPEVPTAATPEGTNVFYDNAVKAYTATKFDEKFGNMHGTGPTRDAAIASLNQNLDAARQHGTWRSVEQPASTQQAQAIPNEAVQARIAGKTVPEVEESYRGLHTAPMRDSGSPMHDLTGTYPDDIYSVKASQYYGHWGDARDLNSIGIIQQMRGKPNAEVRIYRAIPKNLTNAEKIADLESQKAYILKRGKNPPKIETNLGTSAYYDKISSEIDRLKSLPVETRGAVPKINPGDWVTIDRHYAREHGEATLRGEFRVIGKNVKARDIFTNGDSIHEWGYDPQPRLSIKKPDIAITKEVAPAQAEPVVTPAEAAKAVAAERVTKAKEDSITRALAAIEVFRGKVDKHRFESAYQTLRTHAGKLGIDVPSVGTYFNANTYQKAGNAVALEIGKKYGSHPTEEMRAKRDVVRAKELFKPRR